MKEGFKRKVIVFGSYFWEFYYDLNEKTQNKVDWVLSLVQTLEIIPEKFFKSIEGENNLYEIRVKSGRNLYRIFCFFDKGKLVVVLNAFQKKTKKTPKNKIDKAKKIKERYYYEKQNKQYN
jgi:phage-related protein